MFINSNEKYVRNEAIIMKQLWLTNQVFNCVEIKKKYEAIYNTLSNGFILFYFNLLVNNEKFHISN